jgi:isocitrate/isopropylmalate dehydrogenase
VTERRHRVAVVPGDDASPEAVHPALEVLRALGPPIDWDVLPDGAKLARTTTRAERETLIRAAVDTADTVLFGATSGTTGGIGYLRWGKGTYANVRPIRWRPGVPSPLREPAGIDYVIVRENLEDAYTGLEGNLDALLASGLDTRPFGGLVEEREPLAAAGDGRYALKVITRRNTERVAEFACRLALERMSHGSRGSVTVAGKWNVLSADGYFRDVAAEVVARHPELTFEEYLADDFARRLIATPHDLDVVLLPNLYGDLLSDEGAATVGGLGVVPSGCYSVDFAYFEPVHGSAPDIAGTGTINPTATILSAAMLLDHLGLTEYARRLEDAVDATIAAGALLTPDLGGTATTAEFAAAVAEHL